MGKRVLFRRGIIRQKGNLCGICILMFLTMLSLSAVLTVWVNGNSYVEEEMERAGYGSLTAWVSGVPDLNELAGEISDQEGIQGVQVQNLIFSNYRSEETESDSEGQLILWKPDEERYRFLTEDLSGYREKPEEIRQGEIYISPSMSSVLNIRAGDTITFPIARNGMDREFRVAGYYEDPFMGSSMIGMKGFLISEKDYRQIAADIEQEGMNALAREGAMLHIFTGEDMGMTADQINQILNTSTSLPEYTEEIHSAHTIRSFMTILQNAFCGLLAAFAFILFFAAVMVTGHSISGMIEQEKKNLGILKTLGFTGQELIRLQTAQYLTAVALGSVLGVLAAVPCISLISEMIVTTTGLILPPGIPLRFCGAVFSGILILFAGYTRFRLRKIRQITPMDAIRGEMEEYRGWNKKNKKSRLRKEGFTFHLAVRQLLTGKRRYAGACLVAVLLVFFASLAGRMNDWLGPDGQGMMDAFNPADLDLGVQALGERGEEEMEEIILSYTEITDSYVLAMPSVSVNGTNYTANVITEPERFRISRGETCLKPDEVVLTEVLASDLGVEIGDTVTLRGDTGTEEYRIAGIYHCANDMGGNLGMNKEGYLAIGRDDPRIWCHHYFLQDPSRREQITRVLENTYGGDVHVHQNSWPGLSGILSAMHIMLAVMYGIIAVFILVVTVMTGAKILYAEQKDLAVYQSMGCSVFMLRSAFAARFGIAALTGAAVGTICAVFLTDPLVSAVMRLAGISSFASHATVFNLLMPGIAVAVLFFLAAWLLAGRISRIRWSLLTAE